LAVNYTLTTFKQKGKAESIARRMMSIERSLSLKAGTQPGFKAVNWHLDHSFATNQYKSKEAQQNLAYTLKRAQSELGFIDWYAYLDEATKQASQKVRDYVLRDKNFRLIFDSAEKTKLMGFAMSKLSAHDLVDYLVFVITRQFGVKLSYDSSELYQTTFAQAIS
jgi:hypothetical protein